MFVLSALFIVFFYLYPKKTMKLYSSPYVEYLFDQKNSILFETWTSKMLTEDIYKEEMLHKKDLLNQHKPIFILDDISRTNFSISPELQAWTEELFVPILMNLGVKKYAIILPQSIFGQVSMEQTVDEVQEHDLGIEFKYFDSVSNAKDWLLVTSSSNP